jgi:VIT1/CCC1 family predicted Fe2+/Mn2+ transporter
MQERAGPGRRSIAEVVVDIGRNIQDLLRAELRLAQSEVRERLQTAGTLLAAGVIGSLLSAFFLLVAILYGLRLLMPAWAAALCIAFAVAVVALFALKTGIGRLKGRPSRNTGHGIKEDTQWPPPLRK